MYLRASCTCVREAVYKPKKPVLAGKSPLEREMSKEASKSNNGVGTKSDGACDPGTICQSNDAWLNHCWRGKRLREAINNWEESWSRRRASDVNAIKALEKAKFTYNNLVS